jgi:hypothetical protein
MQALELAATALGRRSDFQEIVHRACHCATLCHVYCVRLLCGLFAFSPCPCYIHHYLPPTSLLVSHYRCCCVCHSSRRLLLCLFIVCHTMLRFSSRVPVRQVAARFGTRASSYVVTTTTTTSTSSLQEGEALSLLNVHQILNPI